MLRFKCECSERKKPVLLRDWIVISYLQNFYGPSEWSTVECNVCGIAGRSKGNFVAILYFRDN